MENIGVFGYCCDVYCFYDEENITLTMFNAKSTWAEDL